MPKRKITKYSNKQRKELGLDKVPDTMYDINVASLKMMPIEYEDIDPEELFSD